MRVEREPYPAQVEPVGIVAGTDGNIVVPAFVRVELAGMVKFFKALVVYLEELSLAAFLREFGTACAVLGVIAIVKALAVVEYGKEANDVYIYAGNAASKQESVGFHLVPMLDAVNIRKVRTVREGMFHYGSKVYHTILSSWSRRR